MFEISSKRLVAAIAASSVLMTVAACGSSESTSDQAIAPQAVQEAADLGKQQIAYADGINAAADTDTDVTADESDTLNSAETYYSLSSKLRNSDIAIAISNADGTSYASAGADEEFPALSLIKLLLGYWIVENTTGYEDEVSYMIRYSDDSLADEFDASYPEAISEVIEDFDLEDTYYNGYWGSATTTASDLVSFLEQVIAEDPDNAILTAMANYSDVASDGYSQDYGTANLPGVIGTKFGWSNDETVHATLSYGSGFVIAALGYSSTDQLTSAVKNSVVSTSAES